MLLMANRTKRCDICRCPLHHFNGTGSKYKLCGPAGNSYLSVNTAMSRGALKKYRDRRRLCKQELELYAIPMPLCARCHHFVLLTNLPPESMGTVWRRMGTTGISHLLSVYGIRLHFIVILRAYREAVLGFCDEDEARLAIFLLNKDGGYVFADANCRSTCFPLQARQMSEDEQLDFATKQSVCEHLIEACDIPRLRHPGQRVVFLSNPWREAGHQAHVYGRLESFP